MSTVAPSLSMQAGYIQSLSIAANLVLSGSVLCDDIKAKSIALDLMNCAELIAGRMEEYCDKNDL